jgi:hypothetical protein
MVVSIFGNLDSGRRIRYRYLRAARLMGREVVQDRTGQAFAGSIKMLGIFASSLISWLWGYTLFHPAGILARACFFRLPCVRLDDYS